MSAVHNFHFNHLINWKSDQCQPVRRPVWFVAKVSPKMQDNTDTGCSHLSRTVLFLPCWQQTVKLCTMPARSLFRSLKLLHAFRNPLRVFRLCAKHVPFCVLFSAVIVGKSVYPAERRLELWLAGASGTPVHWKQKSHFRREILLDRILDFKFHFSGIPCSASVIQVYVEFINLLAPELFF